MMSKTWNIGIIGLGGIAQMAHLKVFSSLEDCKVIAGCDIDTRKFKLTEEKFGVKKFHTNYTEMFEKEKLDAVVIGTPNNTHKDISIAALDRGINVLCEKPVCCTASEAEELSRIVNNSKAKFMIGQCFRFRNQTIKISELINSGKLGDIYYCKACYLRKRGIPGFGTWFTDKSRAHGGVILDLGIHLLDYIWFLLGKPEFESVSAMKYGEIGKRKARGQDAGFKSSEYPVPYYGPEKNVFDVEEMGTAFVRFANGIVFQLEVSWIINIPDDLSTGMILGDRGGVTLNPVIYTHDNADAMISEEIPVESVASHDNQARAFIDYLSGKIANPVPIDDGLKVMKAIDAIYESAEFKKEIIIKK